MLQSRVQVSHATVRRGGHGVCRNCLARGLPGAAARAAAAPSHRPRLQRWSNRMMQAASESLVTAHTRL